MVECDIRILDFLDESHCCCGIVGHILGDEIIVGGTVVASSFAILLGELFAKVAEYLYSSTVSTIFAELRHISEHFMLATFLLPIALSIGDQPFQDCLILRSVK